MLMTSRRSFLLGLAAGLAPAVIRTPGLLMPVKALQPVSGLKLIRAADPVALELALREMREFRENYIAMRFNAFFQKALSHAPIVEG